MTKHRIYLGQKYRGNGTYPFGRCLCGAYLKDASEIEAHEELIKLEEER